MEIALVQYSYGGTIGEEAVGVPAFSGFFA
jgi:hypothetical protein